jgi:RNA polymerase sigma-70 factor (ECF subfamily)
LDLTIIDDAGILRLIARQNSEALGVLYDRYGRLVYSIALHAVGNSETAEEIVQDVFTRIWDKAQTYDAAQAKVSTWLVTITRNRSIDELRRNKVRPEESSVDISDLLQLTDHHNPGPEAVADHHWKQKSIHDAIATLPADQQQVLALAYFKGLSHSEIAEALHEPLGTVKTRLRLAMQKLRQVLSAEVAEDS